MIKYTKQNPFRRFTYMPGDVKVVRIDFDRPVILYELQVGMQIVAAEAKDPVHGYPGVKVDLISLEERTRFTFNTPAAAKAGMVVSIHVDRECEANIVTESETIDAQFRYPER